MLRATQSRWCSVLVCFLLWSSSCRESLGFQYQAFIASPPDCGVAETRKRATATTATGSQRFGGWGTYGRNQNNNEPSFNTVLSKNRIRLMKRFSSRRSSEENNDDPSEEKRTTKYDDISKKNIKIALENDRITRLRDEQTKVALVKALLKMEDNDLMSIQLVGKTDLPTTSSRIFRRDMTIPCAVLTTTNTDHDRNRDDPIPAILLPLDEDGENQWTLLQSSMEQPKQATGRMRSVVQQFQWNAALVNRDGGLFDNLPYSTWTMDPNRRLRDASNNVMASKFHPGKRYAYNRLMLLSGRNNNAQYNVMSNVENKRNDNVPMDSENFQVTRDDEDDNDVSSKTLSNRIIALKMKEIEMDIAEWDYNIAIAKNEQNEIDEMYNEEQRRLSLDMLDELQQQRRRAINEMSTLQTQQAGPTGVDDKIVIAGIRNDDTTAGLESSLSLIRQFFDNFASSASQKLDKNYVPVDEQERSDEESTRTQYDTPYGMIREIIRDQLNAEVIGTILENTSLFDGTLSLGGAIVLRRLSPRITVRLSGETVQYIDDDETFGNIGINGGEMILVECQADEAIGMSLACQDTAQLFIEKSIWDRGSVMVRRKSFESDGDEKSELDDIWIPTDPELSILIEGQASNQSKTERVAPIRIPRTTQSLFDRLLDRPSSSSSSSSDNKMFPTDNPIKSLSQYDTLSNEDKARTLLSMSIFDGTLPRPRTVRAAGGSSDINRNVLDDLLLPLIDESVRTQYLIRDAVKRGDMDRARELEQSKSKKLFALEKAQQAREAGAIDDAEQWEKEAALYESLRADTSQNEGSYSRFLDRDEWYERDRQKIAKRIDKTKFGNLLDGIE